MNLRAIDLNLLVVLDALLDEAHVSRAAQRLNLTQPAVSAALQRCRDLFEDELLRRGRGTMHPTEKAEALRAPLKAVLSDVLALVDPPEISLSDVRQTVRVVMADQPSSTLLAPLLAQLSATAPGIDLVVKSWRGAGAARDDLLKGQADLALSVFDDDSDELERRLVLNETYVVAMRHDHPAAEKFDLARWLAFPHIVVSGRGDRRGALDVQLETCGKSRRVGLVVPNFQLVPDILLSTDLIALLPKHAIPDAARNQLKILRPPIAIEGFPLHLCWMKRRNADKAVMHVAGLISDLCHQI